VKKAQDSKARARAQREPRTPQKTGLRSPRSPSPPHLAAAPAGHPCTTHRVARPREPARVHMVGIRPRSPSAHPEPGWAPQPAGPSPAKRPRLDQPAGPDPGPLLALQHPATSLVVLAAGCALRVPLGHVDLVLEPGPANVLTVALQGHKLIVVPEGLLDFAEQHLGAQGHWPDGLELGAFAGAPMEDGGVQHGFFYPAAAQRPAYEEDWDPGVLSARLSSPWCLGPMPSSSDDPDGGPWHSIFDLPRPFPGSPLQPLPPSPSPRRSPGPHARPRRPPRPACKARRRLFQVGMSAPLWHLDTHLLQWGTVGGCFFPLALL
jgi:hypothetical protein